MSDDIKGLGEYKGPRDRIGRINNRLKKTVEKQSAGSMSICKKCGSPFEQSWRPSKGLYTTFDTCADCRMMVARGTSKAQIEYTPHPGQQLVHESTARFKVVAAGARWGKDRCMVMEFITQFANMLSEDRGTEMVPYVHGWIIAPTYMLARQNWRELKAFFPRQWVTNLWEGDKMIETVNGGMIEVRSADDPESLVGVGLDIVLITEAGRIKHFDEVWTNIEMRLASPGRGPNGQGGLGLVNGTPRGLGFYYDMWRWGQKDTPYYDSAWESWQFSSWENPYLMRKDKNFLEGIKKRFPARIYQQEVCVTPDTVIYGQNVKYARDVNVGDFVYSHSGNLRRVNEVMINDFCGDLVGIQSYKSGDILKLTPEHRVLSYRRQKSHRYQEAYEPIWIQAQDLKPGDYVAYPDKVATDCPNMDFIDLRKFAKHSYLETESGLMYYKPKWTSESPNCRKNPKKTVPCIINLNRKVLRMFGLWLAEGHVARNNTIVWSLSLQEHYLADEIINTLKTEFGLLGIKKESSVNHCLNVRVINCFLADCLTSLFGQGARNKFVGEFVQNLSNQQIADFLSGYFIGDGYGGPDKASFGTASKELAKDVRFLLFKLGVESGTYYSKPRKSSIEGREITSNGSYRIQVYGDSLKKLYDWLDYGVEPNKPKYNNTWTANGYRWVAIKKIFRIPYDGKVYNYEIDKDNTFLTENGIVHNCGEFLPEGNCMFPTADDCATYVGEGLPEPGRSYVIGYDPAKSIDYSGVAIRNDLGETVKIEQWMGMDWDPQFDRIALYSKQYNNARIVMDRTGLGETIPSQLIKRGLEVEDIYFSSKEKEILVNNLAMLIEQKRISYPKFEPLLLEFKDYQYQISGKTKNITFGNASKNGHDDLVTAMMLAFKDFDIIEESLPFMGCLYGVGKK